jgi:hypothetical protein
MHETANTCKRVVYRTGTKCFPVGPLIPERMVHNV